MDEFRAILNDADDDRRSTAYAEMRAEKNKEIERLRDRAESLENEILSLEEANNELTAQVAEARES